MPSFLVVGEGFPAFSTLRFLLDSPAASVTGFVAGSHASVRAIELAKVKGVPIFESTILTGERPFAPEALADWLVNINGVVIFKASVLEAFRGHALNMHPGLLPAYAGLHCHQWAIRNGEREHGVTLHFMEPGIDTGAIIAQERLPILDEDTGLSLFMRTMELGTRRLERILTTILEGGVPEGRPQDLSQRRLYRHKDALDGTIDWTLPARALFDFVRATNYEPLASPTYQPEWKGLAQPVLVRAVRPLAARSMKAPGLIETLDGEGPVVACGRGEAVRVLKAMAGGMVLDENGWKRLLPC